MVSTKYVLMDKIKKENKNIRKITRAGRYSLAVTLPAQMLGELGWREKQKVAVSRVKGGILIRDFRTKK
jgi:antitoxin component of MazEF toxin-antitoxin module